jgi:hypothetical protein
MEASNQDCSTNKIIFSIELGTLESVVWRCKDVANCSLCRGIEEGKIRKAMGLKSGKLYRINKDTWKAYRMKINRNSKNGYIAMPQENNEIIVYANVAPSGDHVVIRNITTEQILATRLNEVVKGRISRTGAFAKPPKEDSGNIDAVSITAFLPRLRYKKSGRIMPYTSMIKFIEVRAYRDSPYTEITKDNAEAHLRYVSNYIIQVSLREFANRIEPLVQEVTKSVPVNNFENWIDGADIKMSGVKNKFNDAIRQEMDELGQGKQPFDWVQYCLNNNLVYDSGDRAKAEKELQKANDGLMAIMGF